MGTTWSRQRVIDEIRQWHARGVPVKSIWRQSRTLVAAACAYHGSWRAALQAAGLESERQLWSQERVIRELRERYSAPGTPSRWVDADSRLRAAAKRYFGSWHQALVAAGLRKARRASLRSWTRDEVLQAIRMRPQDDSGVQTPWRLDPRLYSVAKRVFGSWRKALLAAGCEVQTPRPWTRDEVLCEIHTRHAEGQPLTRISRSDPPLYRGAKRHFGNWRNALQAAGIATRPSHSWTKAIITESLRRRHAEGPPLSHVWKDDKPLFCAAIRKFGNWHTALRTAGIEPRPFRKWSPERVIDGLCANIDTRLV